jgi:hypothetical protein
MFLIGILTAHMQAQPEHRAAKPAAPVTLPQN